MLMGIWLTGDPSPIIRLIFDQSTLVPIILIILPYLCTGCFSFFKYEVRVNRATLYYSEWLLICGLRDCQSTGHEFLPPSPSVTRSDCVLVGCLTYTFWLHIWILVEIFTTSLPLLSY